MGRAPFAVSGAGGAPRPALAAGPRSVRSACGRYGTCDRSLVTNRSGWEVEPRSPLHPAVAGGDHAGLLAVHPLSKQSTAAGYRAGMLAGDPDLVRQAWEV